MVELYSNKVIDLDTFKEYCLRKLGAPVVAINIDPDQIDDRVDDAIQFYYDYHYDALERTWLVHRVTQDDVDNEYIEIDDAIMSVVGVYPLNSRSAPFLNAYESNMFNSDRNIPGEGFAVKNTYQMSYNTASIVANVAFAQTVNDLYEQSEFMQFKRHMGQLKFASGFDKIKEGQYIMMEVYKVIDHNEYPKIWNDSWLKKYATALIKRQWGSNLKKYEGVQMPGGVTLNGQVIYDEALTEIDKLEEEMSLKYSEPVNFFVI